MKNSKKGHTKQMSLVLSNRWLWAERFHKSDRKWPKDFGGPHKQQTHKGDVWSALRCGTGEICYSDSWLSLIYHIYCMHMCVMKVCATMHAEKIRLYTTQFTDVENNSVSEGIKLCKYNACVCVCVWALEAVTGQERDKNSTHEHSSWPSEKKIK